MVWNLTGFSVLLPSLAGLLDKNETLEIVKPQQILVREFCILVTLVTLTSRELDGYRSGFNQFQVFSFMIFL